MQMNKNSKTIHSFIIKTRRGSIEKYGRLIMLQHTLSPLSAKGSRSKHVNLIKDIILGLHSIAENWIDYLISFNYLNAIKGKRFRSFCELILTKLTFYEKLLILKEISSIESKDFNTLKSINTIRNAFVHGYSIRNKKFLYKGKKITLWGHIEVLIKDVEIFLRKVSGQKISLLDEQKDGS